MYEQCRDIVMIILPVSEIRWRSIPSQVKRELTFSHLWMSKKRHDLNLKHNQHVSGRDVWRNTASLTKELLEQNSYKLYLRKVTSGKIPLTFHLFSCTRSVDLTVSKISCYSKHLKLIYWKIYSFVALLYFTHAFYNFMQNLLRDKTYNETRNVKKIVASCSQYF